MANIITEYPHFFIATNLNWKKLLARTAIIVTNSGVKNLLMHLRH